MHSGRPPFYIGPSVAAGANGEPTENINVQTELIVLAGAFSGGFVTGQAGFGTGLTALGFWLLLASGLLLTLTSLR